jgi:hypothetical protein
VVSGSQTATTWTSLNSMNARMLFGPIPPTPMQPIVIRLLGAEAPKTDEGTTYGKAKAAAAVMVAFFRSCRRVKGCLLFMVCCLSLISAFLVRFR